MRTGVADFYNGGYLALGVDMGNQSGLLAVDEGRAMVDAGFTRAVIGTGPAPYDLHSEQQISTCAEVGIGVEAYTYLEWRYDPREWARAALRGAGEHVDAVERWWVDIEDNSVRMRGLSLSDKLDYVDACLDEFQKFGVFAHIYTGGWFWLPYMGNTDRYARQGRLLWESNFDGVPNINSWPGCPWAMEQIAGTQYTGTVIVGGQSVDSNAWYVLPDNRAGGIVDMAGLAELEQKVARLERIVAGYGIRNEDGVELDDEAALKYADEGLNISVALAVQNTQAALNKVANSVSAANGGGGGLSDEDMAEIAERLVIGARKPAAGSDAA